MPPFPPPKDPTPTPIIEDVSGGGWASGSPHTQSSGTFVDYAEYTQWMTIQYTRNPDMTTQVATDDYRSLTQVSAVDTHNMLSTRLSFEITVHNSCKIIKGDFTVSSAYQSQKLAILPNKFDKAGYSYGDVSGVNNLYVFGPQGTIITTQPYIRRAAKVAADTAYSFTQTGYSNALQVSGWPDYRWGTEDIGHPYKYYLKDYNDISTGSDHPWSAREAGDTYTMYGGPYNTSSEGAFGDNATGVKLLQLWIEFNCACLGTSQYWQRFPIKLPLASDGQSGPVEADRLAVNPYYDSSFHDYS